MIGHTQPRRIAARSVAERVAPDAREDAPSAVAAARTRLLEHHLERASSCVATTHAHEVGSWWWLSSAPPAVEQGAALAWLSTERATLVEAALSADELGRPELGAALAAVLVPYLWDRSEPGRVLELGGDDGDAGTGGLVGGGPLLGLGRAEVDEQRGGDPGEGARLPRDVHHGGRRA